MADIPDYALYKAVGGYLFDKYGDGSNGGQFFKTFPELHDYSFNNPMVILGNQSMGQGAPLKGVLVSKPAITIHVFGDIEALDDVQDVKQSIYSYLMQLSKVGDYRVELDPRNLINTVSQEQEDNLRLWHATLDVTFMVN
jgi:hypothetical protein